MKFRPVKPSAEATQDIALEVMAGNLVTGPWVKRVEEKMQEVAKAQEAVAVSSGTMALKIALDAIGVKVGDLVIVPDVTFFASASAVMELGATPVFSEVNMSDFMLNEQSVCGLVNLFKGKVKAIVAVRLAGEPIPEWVWGIGVPVIVDSAHSMGPHDSRAEATCYSFHPSKIISGADGGVIATNSRILGVKARELRSFGFAEGTRITNQLGYKGNMTNLSACLIEHALRDLKRNLDTRREVRDIYNKHFGLDRKGLGMYMVMVKDIEAVERIGGIRHYPQPLSQMVYGEPLYNGAKLICDHLVSIPFHEHLTSTEIQEVCDTISI